MATTSNIDYKEIKRWLDHGEISKLAKKHNIEKQTAYHILRGRIRNYTFLEAAILTAMDRKSRIENCMTALKNVSGEDLKVLTKELSRNAASRKAS